MKILVCDDDQKALGRVTALLAEPCRKIQAQLTATEHPEQLKDLSGFDLAFLDIDMKGVNGLTLARRLRAARPDAVIVFVTNFIQYAPEGYEVQAFRYLLKPTLEEKTPRLFLSRRGGDQTPASIHRGAVRWKHGRAASPGCALL